MIRTKGWEYIKNFYQWKIQQFANDILLQENKSIVEFEGERRELIGLRKLIGSIDNDLRVLENDRKKSKPAPKK